MPIHFNHQLGQLFSPLQERALKEAYQTLYAFCGAKKEDHLIFTSSSAEGVNHVVFAAYLDVTRKTGKNHFLCSRLDEAPAIMSMGRLHECGCVFQMVSATPEGTITKKEVAEMITPRTALLSMSWANGLTGVIQPVLEIAQLCKERGILFHVDATHILGKGDYTVEESGADFISFNGPFGGSGLLWIRADQELSPFILGGTHQGGMRGGAFSLSTLVELAQWAKEERAHSDHYGMETARLKHLFEEIICENVPDARLLFPESPHLPHIASFIFPGVASDALYYKLQQRGIHATFGGGHLQHLSHILKACGIGEPDCHCGMSFGFTHSTQEEEIRLGAAGVVETVLKLQHCSQKLMEAV